MMGNEALGQTQLRLNRNNGVIRGAFAHPLSGKAVRLNGVLLQTREIGLGRFSRRGIQGEFQLEPR